MSGAINASSELSNDICFRVKGDQPHLSPSLSDSIIVGSKCCTWTAELDDERPRRFGDIVPGVFTPVLAKHRKSFNLIDTLAVGLSNGFKGTSSRCDCQVEDGRTKRITTGESSSCMPRLWTTSGRQHELFSPKSTAQFKKLDPIPYV